MKKVIFLSLFSLLGVFLLTACGASSSESTASVPQSTTISNKIGSSREQNTSEETTDSIDAKHSSSTQNTQTQETDPSAQESQVSTETTASSTSANNGYPVFTPDQAQALQMLLENEPELDDPDISFAFFNMIGSDYLFKAASISIRQQGGSGTLGFYRVSPQGTVTATDSLGNPL